MNVAFPKAQDAVSAGRKVGVATLVSADVLLLNGSQRCVGGGIPVPEVSVPLDNQAIEREQRVYHKSVADNLLLDVCDTDSVKNRVASDLKAGIGLLAIRDVPQGAAAPRTGAIAPTKSRERSRELFATDRTRFGRRAASASTGTEPHVVVLDAAHRGVEPLAAHLAGQHLAASSQAKEYAAFSGLFVVAPLPSVGASHRTEGAGMAFTLAFVPHHRSATRSARDKDGVALIHFHKDTITSLVCQV